MGLLKSVRKVASRAVKTVARPVTKIAKAVTPNVIEKAAKKVGKIALPVAKHVATHPWELASPAYLAARQFGKTSVGGLVLNNPLTKIAVGSVGTALGSPLLGGALMAGLSHATRGSAPMMVEGAMPFVDQDAPAPVEEIPLRPQVAEPFAPEAYAARSYQQRNATTPRWSAGRNAAQPAMMTTTAGAGAAPAARPSLIQDLLDAVKAILGGRRS